MLTPSSKIVGIIIILRDFDFTSSKRFNSIRINKISGIPNKKFPLFTIGIYVCGNWLDNSKSEYLCTTN